MNIDCHTHYIPERVLQALRGGRRYPEIAIGGDEGELRFKFPHLPWSPAAPAFIAKRAAFSVFQAAEQLDVQILSPWTDLLGYTLPPDVATDWCAFVNEAMAEVTDGRDELWAIGALPLQDRVGAVRELAHVAELGLRGVIIGSALPDLPLDDPSFDPLWSAAAAAGIAIFIHPIFLHPEPELLGFPGLPNTVGRGNATNVAVSRLLLGGVLERHPGLRLVLSHGGAGVPALLSRLERNHELNPDTTSSPSVGFASLFFDSVVVDPRGLRMLLEVARPDQVLLGSDFPFPWEPHPRRTVLAADLGEEVTRLICGENALAVFSPCGGVAPTGTTEEEAHHD